MKKSTEKNRKSKADIRGKGQNNTKKCGRLPDRLQSTPDWFRPNLGVFRMKAAEEQQPPEKRLPIRFRIIRRLGVEIIQAIGRPLGIKSVVCPWVATIGPYSIFYYTRFNPPARGEGWSDGQFQQFKLMITNMESDVCLDVVWTAYDIAFLQTRDPTGNDWDRDLRKLWHQYMKRVEAAGLNR